MNRLSSDQYTERTYRERMAAPDLVGFSVTIRETDMHILAGRDLTEEAVRSVSAARSAIEAWIESHPDFATSLSPLACPQQAPPIVREMYAAAEVADVGPMASVAGAIAEYVARDLARYTTNVIVENGGDIYIVGDRPRTVSIFAGRSPLSERIGLLIPPEVQPVAVCTSSGTVGPSLSFGQADAAVIVGRNGALADAMATAMGNRIRRPEDLESAVRWASQVAGVLHVAAILGNRLAACGTLQLVPLGKG